MTHTPFRLDPAPSTMEPSDLCPAEAFTTDDRSELIHPHLDTSDGAIQTGVWECAPSREVIDAYPVHEMMTVISGALTLTHADGTAESFGPGDTFFIAKGTPVVWEITEKLRKFYMIAE